MTITRLLRYLILSLWISAVIMFGVLMLIHRRLDAPPPPLPTGKPLPRFALTAQDGRRFNTADYKGRPLFLAFVPDLGDDTVLEARSLKGVMERFEEAGGKVFLIVDAPAEAARALHEREKLPFPILLDTGGSVARSLFLPDRTRDTLVADPKGIVAYHFRVIDPVTHGQLVVDVSRCCLDEVQAARSEGIGKPVNDLSVPRADTGEMTALLGDKTQKATLAVFVSVRCPCSNAYNERLAALARDYAPRGVRTVAIYSNVDETATQAAAHAREHGFTFPALHDEKSLCADHLKAAITPQAFVIDAKGILRYAGRIDDKREEKKVTKRELRDALDAVLAGKTPTPSGPAFGCAIPRA